MKTTQEIEACADRLLKNNKPKIIAASLGDTTILSEQQIKHFRTAEYLWNLTPQAIEGPYKGMFMGLLLDESLNYVHIVFASQLFLDCIYSFRK